MGSRGRVKDLRSFPFIPFYICVLLTNVGPDLSQKSDPAPIHAYLNEDPVRPLETGLVPGPQTVYSDPAFS